VKPGVDVKLRLLDALDWQRRARNAPAGPHTRDRHAPRYPRRRLISLAARLTECPICTVADLIELDPAAAPNGGNTRLPSPMTSHVP
jgi:hypothetical protein